MVMHKNKVQYTVFGFIERISTCQVEILYAYVDMTGRHLKDTEKISRMRRQEDGAAHVCVRNIQL